MLWGIISAVILALFPTYIEKLIDQGYPFMREDFGNLLLIWNTVRTIAFMVTTQMPEKFMKEAIILVVDDNTDLAEGMSDLLDALGYDVVVANDGFTALSLMEKTSFDIALMDIKMPGMDGVETLKRIKEINPKIVIEVSGGITTENIDKYSEHADIISMGSITHSAEGIDFSLEIVG